MGLITISQNMVNFKISKITTKTKDRVKNVQEKSKCRNTEALPSFLRLLNFNLKTRININKSKVAGRNQTVALIIFDINFSQFSKMMTREYKIKRVKLAPK